MAKKKKSGVNKSQAIRDYLAKNPDVGLQAASEALKAEGIVVSAAYISTIKSNDKRKGRKGRRGRPRGAGNGAASPKLSMDALLAAKKFADQLGGIEKAKSAVEALAKLV